MYRKLLFYLINALVAGTIILLIEFLGESIVNDSRLIKILLMVFFVSGFIYSLILSRVFKSLIQFYNGSV